MTPRKWVAPLFWVTNPFLKGHGDSRYLSKIKHRLQGLVRNWKPLATVFKPGPPKRCFCSFWSPFRTRKRGDPQKKTHGSFCPLPLSTLHPESNRQVSLPANFAHPCCPGNYPLRPELFTFKGGFLISQNCIQFAKFSEHRPLTLTLGCMCSNMVLKIYIGLSVTPTRTGSRITY